MRLLSIVIAAAFTQSAVASSNDMDAQLAGDITQVTRRDGSASEFRVLGNTKTIDFNGTFANMTF